jgi:hypothetical protein
MRGVNKSLHKAIGVYFNLDIPCDGTELCVCCAHQFNTYTEIEDAVPAGYSLHSTRNSVKIIKHQRKQNTVWYTDRTLYPNYTKSFDKF